MPTALLKLSLDDKHKILSKLQRLTKEGIVVTSQRIQIEILGHEFIHVLKDNQISNPHHAYQFIKHYFRDNFNFQNNCISDFSVEIKKPNNRIIDEFVTKTKFSIQELFDFSKINWINIGNAKALLEIFYENGFFRIDEQTIIQKEYIKFPEYLIHQSEDLIIENMMNDSFFTRYIETYQNFPAINIPWNKHLLAHLIKNYSSRLYVIEHGDSYNNIDYEFKGCEDDE
jgi:hypothetical protein